MGKNLSYRDKLLELSKIYKISEIQNYIRNKKNLTTSQIEHILKKNKVPVPKNFNVGFFERNISKPFSKAGKEVTDIYDDTTSGVNRFFSRLRRGIENTGEQTTSGIGRFFINIWKSLGNLGIGILETFPKLFVTLFNFFGNIFVNTFNNIYNSNATEKKGSQVITIVAIITIFTAVGLIGYNSFDKFKEFATKPSKTITEKKIETKKESSNLKKVEKDKNVKKQPKAKEKILKKEKNPSQVKELVLPNLNLKTETVLSLFDDVEYDLKIVRSKKIVKPIYFTQFPKDLDEIKDVKLKKETFIKIVLPLVVAENEKILNDRIKLKKFLTRRITSDKE